MKCGFCAVQTLEPNYVPYMDIKSKITEIDRIYGERRDLLLMDNNVLRSNQFDHIINDILEAGFEKGASYINPKTGKRVSRYVDFNQGLDANLLTPAKAYRLGEIALRPARIAFDHIEDRKTYERAIRLCAENGITELSNYTLYNSEDFGGKGKSYHADTPEDLYNRMRITLDLKEDINLTLADDQKVSAFSFPMRYIPLSAQKRGYVGSKWNHKFLRAVQCMLIPTQGKGVGNRSFFEADFGSDAQTFVRHLCMPDKLIAARGHFSVGGRGHIGETNEQVVNRKITWEKNQRRIAEWNRLYELLENDTLEFVQIISDNEFLPEKFLGIHSDIYKILYLHYLTEPRILMLLGNIKKGSPTRTLLQKYMTEEFPDMYNSLVSIIAMSETQQQFMFKNFISFFGRNGMKSILEILESVDFNADKQMAVWSRICKKFKIAYIDFELVRIYRRYILLESLPDDAHNHAKSAIMNMDMSSLVSALYEYLDLFREQLFSRIKNEKGEQIIQQTTDIILRSIQLKLFDATEDLR